MDQILEIFSDPIVVGKISVSLFLAIVFLQSGIDKVINWTGNLSWLREHFAKTPLKGSVSVLLGVLTCVELLTGALAAIGAFLTCFMGDDAMAYYGIVGSLIAYLMLIFGQRLAQDYDGAKTIAIYFGISLVGLLLYA